MERDEVYNKSLRLVDKFINETTQEEMGLLMSKFDASEISGPTINEYLMLLNRNLLRLPE